MNHVGAYGLITDSTWVYFKWGLTQEVSTGMETMLGCRLAQPVVISYPPGEIGVLGRASHELEKEVEEMVENQMESSSRKLTEEDLVVALEKAEQEIERLRKNQELLLKALAQRLTTEQFFALKDELGMTG